jgi:hypothetical protein
MTRTFMVRDTPNENGFLRFTVRTDSGRSYLDNRPVNATDNELDLIEQLIEWIREGKE